MLLTNLLRHSLRNPPRLNLRRLPGSQKHPTPRQLPRSKDLSYQQCSTPRQLCSSKEDAPTLHTGTMQRVQHATATGVRQDPTVSYVATPTLECKNRPPTKPVVPAKLPMRNLTQPSQVKKDLVVVQALDMSLLQPRHLSLLQLRSQVSTHNQVAQFT